MLHILIYFLIEVPGSPPRDSDSVKLGVGGGPDIRIIFLISVAVQVSDENHVSDALQFTYLSTLSFHPHSQLRKGAETVELSPFHTCED